MSVQEMMAIPAAALEAVTDPEHRWVAICRGTGCTSSASTEVQQSLQEELDQQGLNGQVEVRRTGCFGQIDRRVNGS